MLFVTGSESFIGRVLIARCRKDGLAVTGIDARAPVSPDMHQADIRDPRIAELIPEGAMVVHLAAISRDADCRADPRAAFDVNVAGTLNVLTAATARKARQIIFASTEWVYGEVRSDSSQREDQAIDITAIKSDYALSKIVAEQYLRLASALPATTILRFGIVYGPRGDNWSAFENLVHAVRTKSEINVGSLATARRFIHVNDIVAGILAATRRGGFEIFNLSGNQPISLGEIISTAKVVSGRNPAVIETNPQQPSIRNPDNSKARAALQWNALVDLNDGVCEIDRFLSRET
jgi:nucleoside-diphosphate-sugar epimerase